MSKKYVSNFEMLGENIEVKDGNLWRMLNVGEGSTLLTVGKKGAEFTTINEAIQRALYLGVSTNNPVCIFIYAGVYEEQIILNDVHGLSFVGCGVNKTLIKYNGNYPDCVVHVQGTVSFDNLTIAGSNPNTYVVHSDPLDTDVKVNLHFNNCVIQGGSSAIGHGGGSDSLLWVHNCFLSGKQNILYLHNSSYNKSGQRLYVTNNLFYSTSEEFCVLLDDAGYSNGGVASPMRVVFANNSYTGAGYGKIRFRKATNFESTWTSYLPINDSNIMCGAGCKNNGAMVGLNHYEGKIDLSQYITLPSSPDVNGDYTVSIFIPVDGNNYFATINDITLPGVGSVTSNFSVTNRTVYALTLSTKDSNYAGKSMSASITLTCL